MEQHPDGFPITNPRTEREAEHYQTAEPKLEVPSASSEHQEHHRPQSRKRVAIFLFVATWISTFLVGMTSGGGIIRPEFLAQLPKAVIQELLLNGLTYGCAVMLILMAHEMGHYLQARRYGAPASLPYFIPMPFSPLGTMGAVIFQGMRIVDGKAIVDTPHRKALFDIAISGPLAGLVFALPITWIGISQAELMKVPDNYQGIIFGDPLIVQWFSNLIHGPRPVGYELNMNPLLFAGWVGIFVTALNLIPIGQLDGGHILYSLAGEKARYVGLAMIATAIGYMIFNQSPSYAVMLFLLIMMGTRHPPTADDTVPLGWMRILLGWLTLAFIFIGFTPEPLSYVGVE